MVFASRRSRRSARFPGHGCCAAGGIASSRDRPARRRLDGPSAEVASGDRDGGRGGGESPHEGIALSSPTGKANATWILRGGPLEIGHLSFRDQKLRQHHHIIQKMPDAAHLPTSRFPFTTTPLNRTRSTRCASSNPLHFHRRRIPHRRNLFKRHILNMPPLLVLAPYRFCRPKRYEPPRLLNRIRSNRTLLITASSQ